MSQRPLVSVVLNTYNRADLLPCSAESVLSQDYPNFEVIIVDDCSSDNTPEVVAAIAAEHGDRVRSVRLSENSGLAAGRNAGVRAARGPLIAFQDDDDLWLPGRLTAQVEALRKHPECALCYGKALVATPEGRPTGETYRNTGMGRTGDNFEAFLRWGTIVLPATVVRAEVLESVGLFAEDLRTGEDTDLLARLTAEHHAVYVDRPVMLVREHEGRKTREEDRSGADVAFGLRVFERLWDNLPPSQEHLRGLVAARLVRDGLGQLKGHSDAPPGVRELGELIRSHPEWFRYRDALWMIADELVGPGERDGGEVEALAAILDEMPGDRKLTRRRMAMFYGLAAPRAARPRLLGLAPGWCINAARNDPWFFARKEIPQALMPGAGASPCDR